MKIRLGTVAIRAWSVRLAEEGEHAGLLEMLPAGQPALDHTHRSAVAGELVDQRGASAGECALRHLARQRSEEHTSELQSHSDLVCRLLLEQKTTRPVQAHR